jgi:hypothetical protein
MARHKMVRRAALRAVKCWHLTNTKAHRDDKPCKRLRSTRMTSSTLRTRVGTTARTASSYSSATPRLGFWFRKRSWSRPSIHHIPPSLCGTSPRPQDMGFRSLLCIYFSYRRLQWPKTRCQSYLTSSTCSNLLYDGVTEEWRLTLGFKPNPREGRIIFLQEAPGCQYCTQFKLPILSSIYLRIISS